jgi:hypothetical protein
MRPKRWRGLKPGISRSTAFAAASRNLWNGEAQAAFGASMARAGKGLSADPLHRNRQHQARLQIVAPA